MSLVVRWYDFICFAMVAGAVLASLWVIWRKEGARKWDDNKMFESLLDGNYDRPETNTRELGYLSSSQLWTSCWRGVHPGWLLGLRLGSFLIMAGFQSWDVVDWTTSIYVYYTEWTFTLVIVYFALGTIASAHGCWVYNSKLPSENGESDDLLKRDLEDYTNTIKSKSQYARDAFIERAGFLGYLMQIIYQTCAGAVILTDFVFWFVIVPFLSNAHFGLNMLMGCMHSLNLFFLLLDTSLNNLPFPWFRASYFVLWSCIYVTFQWTMHACGFTWWPYPFLELSSAWAPLWYFCLALIHIPCYGIFALIMKAKVSFFSRWFPHAFVGSH